jgi:nucleoside-diphosphate-sugar epimerase
MSNPLDEPVLVTGAAGFIGSRVVESLLRSGAGRVRCFVRPASSRARLEAIAQSHPAARLEFVEGNVLSRDDCARAAAGAGIVYHLAAGIGKSYDACYLTSVVGTRNLLEAVAQAGCARRFVNVSSLAVYSNVHLPRHALLDESCELDARCLERHEPYAWAKLKQDELVMAVAAARGLSYAIVRPGAVYGPGKPDLTARVGIDTFGLFLHLGGSNQIPFTYVDNCADAIVLAGTAAGADGEAFNVVDDDLPTSRQFILGYTRHVGPLRRLWVPYRMFSLFCRAWETYSAKSGCQLPPVFNRRRCAIYWKGNRFSNRKLKERLGWGPHVTTAEGLASYFAYLKAVKQAPC